MSFKNHWMRSNNYYFQGHQLHFQPRCCFSQTTLHQLQLLPALWLALPVLSPALPVLFSALPIVSQACTGSLLVLPDIQYPGRFLTATPRCAWWSLYQSRLLWYLTTLGFWTDNSQILPDALNDNNKYCWCRCSLGGSWWYMSKFNLRYHSEVYLMATVLFQSILGFDYFGILVWHLPNTSRGYKWYQFILMLHTMLISYPEAEV